MKTLMKWSLDGYHQLIDNGVLVNKNVEFLDGELIEMPPEIPLVSGIIRGDSTVMFSMVTLDNKPKES